MKRISLIKHLQNFGCVFVREGGNHSVFLNPIYHKTSVVPRHIEIHSILARKICRDLGVPEPKNRGK